MDSHLGYSKSERSDNKDYRNGYKNKTISGNFGELEISVPQDRQSSFEPQIVKKRQKDISSIDQKIILNLPKKVRQSHIRRLYGKKIQL